MQNYSELRVNPNPEAALTNTMLIRAVQHLYILGLLSLEDAQAGVLHLEKGLPIQITFTLGHNSVAVEATICIIMYPSSPFTPSTESDAVRFTMQKLFKHLNTDQTKKRDLKTYYKNENLQLWMLDMANDFWKFAGSPLNFKVALSTDLSYTTSGATQH